MTLNENSELNQLIPKPRPLNEEETEVYKDCLRQSTKAGLFCAIGVDILRLCLMPKVIVDPNVSTSFNGFAFGTYLMKRLPSLAGTFICGFALWNGHCYFKTKQLYLSNIKREMEYGKSGVTPLSTEPSLIKEDELNFQSNLDSGFDSSNYSSLDFGFDSTLGDSYASEIPELEDPADEENKKKKNTGTTYEELRQRNRENYSRASLLNRQK